MELKVEITILNKAVRESLTKKAMFPPGPAEQRV